MMCPSLVLKVQHCFLPFSRRYLLLLSFRCSFFPCIAVCCWSCSLFLLLLSPTFIPSVAFPSSQICQSRLLTPSKPTIPIGTSNSSTSFSPGPTSALDVFDT